MSIEFECECGKTIRVKDDAAGRKIRCPSCDVALRVPENDDDKSAAVTVAPPKKPPAPSFEIEDRERTPPKPRRRTDDDEEDDDRPRKSRRRDDDDDDDDDDDRPRKKRRRRKDDDDDDYDYARPPRRSMSGLGGSSGYSAANAGATLAAGILMMVGAVVWFALGLVAGIIFFYPPVLFILGIVAACRGVFQLMNSDH